MTDTDPTPTAAPQAGLCDCLDDFVRAGHTGNPLDWDADLRAEYARFAAAYQAAHPTVVTS